MTRQNADNANKTNETTVSNGELIGTGSVAVKNMSQAMDSINESAAEISKIIKTIEDVAFQTNLLALNAAVEAARAGEAGKGFAVVADEVRNLAQRSAHAAKETNDLITGTVERVRNGSAVAAELDSSFKQIEEGSQTVARLIANITSATNDQAVGVDHLNTAVANMDKVTQENAASAEETASAAAELSSQSESLNEIVNALVGMVEGRGGARRDNSPRASISGRPVIGPGINPPAKPRAAIAGAATLPSSSVNRPPVAAKAAGNVMRPRQVIPLDGDEGFEDF